jgi:hypothetical protein
MYYMLSRILSRLRCERGKEAGMTTTEEPTVTQMRGAHGGLLPRQGPRRRKRKTIGL